MNDDDTTPDPVDPAPAPPPPPAVAPPPPYVAPPPAPTARPFDAPTSAAPPPPYAAGPGVYGAGEAPQPQQAYPGAYPAPPPRPGGGKNRTGLVLLFVGIGVVVLIVAVVGIVALTRLGGATGPGATTAPQADATAEGAVTAYLEAVADGDAETALSFFSDAPSNDLLTDEALTAAQEAAPLTDIEVESESGATDYSADVTATYSLGDEEVTSQFVLGDSGDGWVFYNSLPSLELSSVEGLALEVNGLAVDEDRYAVFPGAYTISTSTPYFELTGTTTYLLADSYESGFVDAEPVLTEEGLGVFRQLVTDAVNACIASTSLDPGCGLGLPASLDDGTQIVDGSIRRSLDADAQAVMANLEPEAISSPATSVPIPFIGRVDATFDCTQGGVSYVDCTLILGGEFFTGGIVDFAGATPVVRWD